MLITGTRKGIGKYLAQYYLERGFSVAGCARGDSSIAHGDYRHFQVDVGDEAAVKGMVRDAADAFDGLDVLLNNAGIASMNHILLTPLSTVEKVFRTNVFGTFLVARECAKVMSRAKSGRIVNFATVATPLNLEGEAVYAASKAAVESLTRVMAKEVGAFNITVNAVGPTPVKTDLVGGVPAEKMDRLISMQAIRRWGEFSDISNVVDFLISPESSFITGQVIYLGGIC
jgi:3-oxoacyl-[acyl-carrier protein] reductase